MLTCARDEIDLLNITGKQLAYYINQHRATVVPQITKNYQYYVGNHDILNRKKKSSDEPNNKIVCNHAKNITDLATGYFMGNPINYKADDIAMIKTLIHCFDKANVTECDSDNAKDMSIYGRAFEYVYAKANSNELAVINMDADKTFVVYDDTVEMNELFAVYYYTPLSFGKVADYYKVMYITSQAIVEGRLKDTVFIETSRTPNVFNEININEYYNNKEAMGDFQMQMSLIDAYNTLMSDRLNDKEQFVQSILALYGTLLGDDIDEKVANRQLMEDTGIIELPIDSKAEYLTKTFDEAGVEILRSAIESDIYKFAQIPCLTDENFASNQSGVAMAYKLLGLEMITKIKQRYYQVGLRKRIRLFASYLNVLKGAGIDADLVEPVFTRALPQNLNEYADIIAKLEGKVSTETLIGLLPFVTDVQTELDKLNAEKAENIKNQQAIFGQYQSDIGDDADGQEE